MTRLIRSLTQQEQLNFLLTNRVPRKLLTHSMGWYSKIESEWLTRISLAIWRLFADLDLSDAKRVSFRSLHECFIRELKEGARTIDQREGIVVSPCDGIVGACGSLHDTTVYQAKGFPYELSDLIPDAVLQEKYANGLFVTLRLTSTMYHRFHAPIAGSVDSITYISGDTWNVNPVALKRIESLYCKNERAVLELKPEDANASILLVPVAAILVASLRFHCLDQTLDLKYKGPSLIECESEYEKGDEIGYFHHGSTIILFATNHYRLCDGVKEGAQIKMGLPLLTTA